MDFPFKEKFNIENSPIILFEDYYLAVIQKPFGYSVEKHPNYSSIEKFYNEKLKIEFPDRKKYFIGIVHRLDVVTAGLVIIAKTPLALKHLNKQFEDKKVIKHYLAAVEGKPNKEKEKVTGFIWTDKEHQCAEFSLRKKKDGKAASLNYELIDSKNNYSLINIIPDTGRFHQIRSTFAFKKHVLVNDVKYGAEKIWKENKIALLANRLEFLHPKSGEPLKFQI